MELGNKFLNNLSLVIICMSMDNFVHLLYVFETRKCLEISTNLPWPHLFNLLSQVEKGALKGALDRSILF